MNYVKSYGTDKAYEEYRELVEKWTQLLGTPWNEIDDAGWAEIDRINEQANAAKAEYEALRAEDIAFRERFAESEAAYLRGEIPF